jgi:hypothetical protein
LALAGVVTGEDLGALAAVLQTRIEPAVPRPMSPLEEDLAARLPSRPAGRGRAGARMSQQRYRDLKRSVGRRLDAEAEGEEGWGGRWLLVNRNAVMGPSLRGDERGLRLAQIALDRYGIVAPEIITRFETRWTWADEGSGASSVRALWEVHRMADQPPALRAPREVPVRWAELSEPLQRMEMREIRQGTYQRRGCSTRCPTRWRSCAPRVMRSPKAMRSLCFPHWTPRTCMAVNCEYWTRRA